VHSHILVGVVFTLLLLDLALSALSERKVVPPGLETGLGWRYLGLLRVVNGSRRHEFVRTGAWRGCALGAGTLGRGAVLESGRNPVVVTNGVGTRMGGAVAGCASLAIAAPVPERLKVLPHALLLNVSYYKIPAHRL
jgi:hypothetical protein